MRRLRNFLNWPLGRDIAREKFEHSLVCELEFIVTSLLLIQLSLQVEWRGLTGRIKLKEGRRVQFKLDLMRLKQHAIVKVGEWTPESRLNITDRSVFFDASPMNVTLVAITILVSEQYAVSMGLSHFPPLRKSRM